MKVKVIKVPKAQNGMSIPVTSGEGVVAPVAELEEGEVYKNTQGAIVKVDDDAGTHEEGGVLLDDVHKVLEDTGDKRDDIASKVLLLTPDEVFQRTGFRPNRSVTHSKAFELAVKHYDKKLKTLEGRINNSLKNAEKTKYRSSQNSLDLNLMLLEQIPTKDQLFESLFENQEEVKEEAGIENPDVAKAQFGLENFKLNDFSMTESDQLMDSVLNPVKKKIPKTLQQELLEAAEAGIIELPKGITPMDIKDYSEETDNEKSGKPKGTTPSTFNQPVEWYDIMEPMYSILNSRKTPVRVNAPRISTPQGVRTVDVRSQLAAGEAAFNRAMMSLPNNGIGFANLASVFAQKYAMDNQILGQAENVNNQILNEFDRSQAQARTQQSAIDAQAIDTAEMKRLTRDEAFRQQRLKDLGKFAEVFAKNRRFNREGQMLLNMFPHFDQTGTYNNNAFTFQSSTSNQESQNTGSGNDLEVVNLQDPNTGQPVPFVKVPNTRGGYSLKRLTFNVRNNQNWTNTK